MKKTMLLAMFATVLAIMTNGCGNKLVKNLEKAAEVATGPCGQAVAAAIQTCNATVPAK